MERHKQTDSDHVGRTKRNPRDPGPGRSRRSRKGPIDDLYDHAETVDRDLDVEPDTPKR
ncbi:MAG TPA: hypothetical protein VFQ53_35470 [Kofleriaceae bacterium]|nr:hypothetical protein [Kofleriaceae bacterium]